MANNLLRATSDRESLTEASLFARQVPNQLPELRERQLPIVVLVQRAHQLLHGPGVAGVLWEITESRFNSFSLSERLLCHLMAQSSSVHEVISKVNNK